jgi:hypothetical protein
MRTRLKQAADLLKCYSQPLQQEAGSHDETFVELKAQILYHPPGMVENLRLGLMEFARHSQVRQYNKSHQEQSSKLQSFDNSLQC